MFVTLEGIDGAGKSTQAARLAEALGPETVLLREPGGTALGERLREILKDPDVELGARAETMLFCAARAELVESVIRPARAAGRDVVCDRFLDSTVAYQGCARGLGRELVERLNEAAVGDCTPDLTILLRLEPGAARFRAEGRGAADDRFEGEGIEFQRTISAAFDELAAAEPERWAIVDAGADPDRVGEAVLAAVTEAGRR